MTACFIEYFEFEVFLSFTIRARYKYKIKENGLLKIKNIIKLMYITTKLGHMYGGNFINLTIAIYNIWGMLDTK